MLEESKCYVKKHIYIYIIISELNKVVRTGLQEKVGFKQRLEVEIWEECPKQKKRLE